QNRNHRRRSSRHSLPSHIFHSPPTRRRNRSRHRGRNSRGHAHSLGTPETNCRTLRRRLRRHRHPQKISRRWQTHRHHPLGRKSRPRPNPLRSRFTIEFSTIASGDLKAACGRKYFLCTLGFASFFFWGVFYKSSNLRLSWPERLNRRHTIPPTPSNPSAEMRYAKILEPVCRIPPEPEILRESRSASESPGTRSVAANLCARE